MRVFVIITTIFLLKYFKVPNPDLLTGIGMTVSVIVAGIQDAKEALK